MNFGKRKMFTAPASQGSSRASIASGQSGDLEDFDDGESNSSKRKSRNLSEKRRRDQFNMLISELSSMVSTSSRKMDKTTVLKSTISFLKTQNEISHQTKAHEIKEDWKPSFLSNDEFSQLMLQSLDGFLLVVTQSGTILYTSESVTPLLTHLPSDLINRSLYDFTHPDERIKIYQMLSSHKVVSGSHDLADYERGENQLEFTCHLKCGTTLSSETPVYELVECQGNFRHWSSDIGMFLDDSSYNDVDLSPGALDVCFCCTVRLKNSQMIKELSVVDESKKEFTSRHSMEWNFLFLDHRGPPIIGHLPFEVLGTSGYDYYHPDDLEKVAKCHEQLMQTGKGTSCYYRFLTKGQQWIWLQTSFYITYHQWNSKPEFIVSTNTVAGYDEVRAYLREQEELEREMKASLRASTDRDAILSPPADKPSSSVWPAVGSPQGLSAKAESENDFVDTTDQGLVPSTSTHQGASRGGGQGAPPPPQSPVTPGVASGKPQDRKPPQLVMPTTPAPPTPTDNTQQVQQSGNFEATQPAASTAISTSTEQSVSTTQDIQAQLYLTAAQQTLQEQLRQKHAALQETINRQQEELRQIAEQLALISQMTTAAPEPQALLAPHGVSQQQQSQPQQSQQQSQQLQPKQQQHRAKSPQKSPEVMVTSDGPAAVAAQTNILVPVASSATMMAPAPIGMQLAIPMVLPQQVLPQQQPRLIYGSPARFINPPSTPDVHIMSPAPSIVSHASSMVDLHTQAAIAAQVPAVSHGLIGPASAVIVDQRAGAGLMGPGGVISPGPAGIISPSPAGQPRLMAEPTISVISPAQSPLITPAPSGLYNPSSHPLMSPASSGITLLSPNPQQHHQHPHHQ